MTEVEQQAPAPTTEAPAKEEVVEEKKVEAEAENKEGQWDSQCYQPNCNHYRMLSGLPAHNVLIPLSSELMVWVW